MEEKMEGGGKGGLREGYFPLSAKNMDILA